MVGACARVENDGVLSLLVVAVEGMEDGLGMKKGKEG